MAESPEAPKRGRPPLPFTPEESETLLSLVRAGASVRQACLQACVSRTRLGRNLEEDPEFRTAFERAEADGKSADGTKIPKTKRPELPAFMAKVPAVRKGPEPRVLDLLEREKFLELLRTGLKKHSALRTLQSSVRAFRNTLDAEPDFQRDVWDAEDERRESYHTVLHSAAVGGEVMGDTDVAKFLYREEIKVEELEEGRERRREAKERGSSEHDQNRKTAFALSLARFLLPLIDPDKLELAVGRLDSLIEGIALEGPA